MEWNDIMGEGHLLNKCSTHYKVVKKWANKDDGGKNVRYSLFV
jgi:hypothetical protein